jgi:hypothetical protein
MGRRLADPPAVDEARSWLERTTIGLALLTSSAISKTTTIIMNNLSLRCSALLLCVAISTPVLVADEEVPSREDVAAGYDRAIVSAVNLDSRSVVLKFEDGREETFVFDEEFEIAANVGVGDSVLAGYARSFGIELRPPTPEELANPLDITEEFESPETAAGTARTGRLIRAVTTVEVLDRINMTATLKGPMGQHLTIDVENPDLLTQVNIGQTVVATYTEAVVISLTKAD